MGEAWGDHRRVWQGWKGDWAVLHTEFPGSTVSASPPLGSGVTHYVQNAIDCVQEFVVGLVIGNAGWWTIDSVGASCAQRSYVLAPARDLLGVAPY